MSVDEISKMVIHAYDSIASAYMDAYSENDEQDYQYLDDFVRLLDGNSILDMGCGTGGNAHFLSRRNLNVVGVDASDGMLDVARNKFPDLIFYRENIIHTSFENSKFDGIVLAYVINHFNSDGLVLLKKEIDRVLKTNGIVFVSAHIGNSEEVVSDPLDENVKIYYNFLSVQQLDELFTGYRREYYRTRESFGEDEFLCDKMFVIYRKL